MPDLARFPAEFKPIRYIFRAVLDSPHSVWAAVGEEPPTVGLLAVAGPNEETTFPRKLTPYLSASGYLSWLDSQGDEVAGRLGSPLWSDTDDFFFADKPDPQAANTAHLQSYLFKTILREAADQVVMQKLEIAVRLGSTTAEPTTLPPDLWDHIRMRDWSSGRGLLIKTYDESGEWRTGEDVYSLHFRSDAEAAITQRVEPSSEGRRTSNELRLAQLLREKISTDQMADLSFKPVARLLEGAWSERHPGRDFPSERTFRRARQLAVTEAAARPAETAALTAGEGIEALPALPKPPEDAG